MQVSPCGHQCLCRLCFVQNIKEAVAARNLPLRCDDDPIVYTLLIMPLCWDVLFVRDRCLICNAKIARVKNNRTPEHPEQSFPVHVRGRTTNIMTRSSPGEMVPKRMPTSVSGYSLCPTTTSEGAAAAPTHARRAANGMPFSQSSYSMSSGETSHIETMYYSVGFELQRGVKVVTDLL